MRQGAVFIILLVLFVPMLRTTGQMPSSWQVGNAPPFLDESTAGGTLRNGARAVHTQAQMMQQWAGQMGSRAGQAGYDSQTFWRDYQQLQWQWQGLRSTFNAFANVAGQLNSASAANAVSELQGGLNIIGEAFNPVASELQTTTLNRQTVVNMCRILQEALGVWDNQLEKSRSRLNLVF